MSVENDYVRVPRQATPEMLEATRGLFREWHEGDADCVWSAMIEAADAIPCSSGDNGFRNAFYEIAALLGLSTAQSASPRKVYETQILPRLKAMLAANNDHLRRLVGRLDQWRLSMSYNESYFGEPAGLLKSTVRELALAVDPIYPPKPEPIDPLAGVTICSVTVPLATARPPADAPAAERMEEMEDAIYVVGEDDFIIRLGGHCYRAKSQMMLTPAEFAAINPSTALQAALGTANADKYAELIYAVGNKYPGESRHETALRYIRQAEATDEGPAKAANGAKP